MGNVNIVFLIFSALVLFAVAILWFLRKVWFYRNPNHSNIPQNHDTVLSPVYGIVAYVKKIRDGFVTCEKKGESIPITEITKSDWPSEESNGNGWLIGIAMTALDVHYQYSPLPAQIEKIQHIPAKTNLPMFDLWEYVRITWFRRLVQLFGKKYLFQNERQVMWLQGNHIKLGLVLIADKFVNKITTFVSSGDTVPAGGKLSFIGRGSQVDVVVCGIPELQILVQPGDKVKGPNTILARLPELSSKREKVVSAAEFGRL